MSKRKRSTSSTKQLLKLGREEQREEAALRAVARKPRAAKKGGR